MQTSPNKQTLRQLARHVGGRSFRALHFPTRRIWVFLGGITPWGKMCGWPDSNPGEGQFTTFDPDDINWIQMEV